MRLIVCQECKRQWDATHYRVGQKLRCVCNFVMEVPPLRSYTPDVHHCQSCGASRAPGHTPCHYCGAVPVRDSADLTLVCPLCLRRTPKESKFCASCGEALHPGRLDATTGQLACPRCRDPKLLNRKIGQFMVDECSSCSGMWVDVKAFDGIVRQQAQRGKEEYRTGDGTSPERSKLDRTQTTVAYLKCPACGQGMNRRNFMRASGVIIDECRADGVWLDCDELGKIGAYLASGGLEHSRKLLRTEEEQTRPVSMEPSSPAVGGVSGTLAGGDETLSSVLSFVVDLLDS
ncbi:MAG: zf-TFIIB domain-containing protein [Vicinamibacteria bacterium]